MFCYRVSGASTARPVATHSNKLGEIGKPPTDHNILEKKKNSGLVHANGRLPRARYYYTGAAVMYMANQLMGVLGENPPATNPVPHFCWVRTTRNKSSTLFLIAHLMRK